MAIIFITGLSGSGKSTTIKSLKSKGYHAFDLDYGFTQKKIDNETIIDEKKLEALLLNFKNEDLFLSACYSNQGDFYHLFKHVVLLDAPLSIMKERIENRTSNHYGKQPNEWIEVQQSYDEVLPLLRIGADKTLNTLVLSVDEVANQCIMLLEID